MSGCHKIAANLIGREGAYSHMHPRSLTSQADSGESLGALRADGLRFERPAGPR